MYYMPQRQRKPTTELVVGKGWHQPKGKNNMHGQEVEKLNDQVKGCEINGNHTCLQSNKEISQIDSDVIINFVLKTNLLHFITIIFMLRGM